MLGRTVLFALIFTAVIGTVHAILIAAIVLAPFSRSAYRTVVEAVEWTWLTNAAAMIEMIAGVNIRATGDALLGSDRRVLIICNHNNRLDWMFLWCLAARVGLCSTLKIALKDSLRRAPWFGWAMQAFLFVFLRRNDRDGDLRRIRETLAHCIGHGDGVALLVFPEGTDLSPDNQAKDAKYAQQKSLQVYRHVLHPRTAGFAQTCQAYGSSLDAIYDVTVRYDNHSNVTASADPRPSEGSALLKGCWPGCVHFHCERYAVQQVAPLLAATPDAASKAEAWLNRVWMAKEKRLAEAAAGTANPQLTPRPTLKYVLVMFGWSAVTLLLCSWGGWTLLAYTVLGSGVLGLITQAGGLDAFEYGYHRAPHA